MHGIKSVEAAEFTPAQLSTVNIQHQRIHQHATATFNFTTYNVLRDQDTINSNTERHFVMLKSDETDEEGVPAHPYWYARVLGVYHANVYHRNERSPRRCDFLWVRWLGRDPEWDSGPRHLRLDRVGYVPEDYPEAFGFLDPAHVLRACHLIPAFALGKTTSLLRPSTARDSEDGDWTNYYVMRYINFFFWLIFLIPVYRFVDRDMMMRYLGTGVGHMQPEGFPSEVGAINPLLQDDRWELEIPQPADSPPQDASEPHHENDGGEADPDDPLDAQDMESGDEDESGEEGFDNDDEDDGYLDF